MISIGWFLKRLIQCAVEFQLKRITDSSAATVTVSLTDWYIRYNCAAQAGVATLPLVASAKGRIYHIKKVDTTSNSMTVKGNGTETIDGANTKVFSTAYAAITVMSNGTTWDIL